MLDFLAQDFRTPGIAPDGAERNSMPLRVTGDVGPFGRNERDDVRAVQNALARHGHFDLNVTGKADGFAGQRLVNGIRTFQKHAGLKQDGLIAPGGPTETALKSGTGPKTRPQVASRHPSASSQNVLSHRRNRPKNKGKDVADNLYVNMTRWHFEDRAAQNTPLPQTEKEAVKMGFRKYPNWQAAEHQNRRGQAERKYGHPDGREVVFDGDTGALVTDDTIRGTYNYVTPPPFDPNHWEFGDLGDFVVGGGAHLAVDWLPYKLLGNSRGR